jgi:hypothetical protein
MIAWIKEMLSLRSENEQLRREVEYLKQEVEYLDRIANEAFGRAGDYFATRHREIEEQNTRLMQAMVDLRTYQPVSIGEHVK